MAKYGIPYQGSKSGIADSLIAFLPHGKRFVDLFGGGAAMSDCALKSGKYQSVFYNELNPLLCGLVKRAISGEFNYNRFKPEFISHEEFDKHKNKDGYIKWIWSFGNDGKSYMFSKEIEPQKRSLHNYVVFGAKDEFIKAHFNDIDKFVIGEDIRKRRLLLRRYMQMKKARRPHMELQQLERLEQLEQLQQLQQLQQLERLERLEINCGSYLDYEYQDGDVVYCDPPYEGTAGYGAAFNHKEFYDWVASRPYQVFFSSYKISDKRFKIIWQKQKQNLKGGAKGQFQATEFLYTNKIIKPEINNPLSVFQSILYG